MTGLAPSPLLHRLRKVATTPKMRRCNPIEVITHSRSITHCFIPSPNTVLRFLMQELKFHLERDPVQSSPRTSHQALTVSYPKAKAQNSKTAKHIIVHQAIPVKLLQGLVDPLHSASEGCYPPSLTLTTCSLPAEAVQMSDIPFNAKALRGHRQIKQGKKKPFYLNESSQAHKQINDRFLLACNY